MNHSIKLTILAFFTTLHLLGCQNNQSNQTSQLHDQQIDFPEEGVLRPDVARDLDNDGVSVNPKGCQPYYHLGSFTMKATSKRPGEIGDGGETVGPAGPLDGTPYAGLTDEQAKANVANQANHVFGPKSSDKHKLGSFLGKFDGDQIGAFKALENATQVKANSSAISGIFETTVTVKETIVTVRGRVVDGIVKLSTAFIP